MHYLLNTNWWKWSGMALLTYVFVAGLLVDVPRLPILNETIRVLHFHVPMWFGMIFLFLASVIYSIRHLRDSSISNDIIAANLAESGVIFGFLGLVTGMFWATFTWGEPWSNDPKQNASAIGLLIYLAYFVLRGSIQDPEKRSRISAVYNIFAFLTIIPLLFILPRLTDSLHPGNGGNPGFNAYDLDSRLRLVFYPAVLGWTIVGFWLASVRTRIALIENKTYD